ncbi:alpha/beta fold hydrolase [Methylobacterium sp. NEAU 140]|uniref:alpha/beta fold hydrolase n=1 Tax=Methylobacterium sp. NEAU 140 TaxID=3064945 RepID=UPI0027331294|nr:alpha/beta fold hydrolase [Methylobacterium sp. NEAU 140]MDP4023000.1 alpha/beta fold hydrolase [Methylobacterium sp. NEAU 140]
MGVLSLLRIAAAGAVLSLTALAASAADYPAPKEGDWTVRDFKFHTGEILPELRLHYTTVGDPKGEPVVVLHGTTGSAASMLTPGFAGELFGPGQPLDATKYFIVIPDAIGHGKSSKPSDGLKAKFPKYDYDDMAQAQYRLLREHLGLDHVRLIIGNSMGGMHAWILGVRHPGYMDALVPMASQPTEMAGRNWMMRRLLIETIRRDPAYADGAYTAQPPSLRVANVFFALGTSGGTLALQKQGSTGERADRLVDARLAAPFGADANDYVYQWESSRGYDPSPGLERIEAAVLAINAADDERNLPETGIMERAMKRVKNGRLYLIPASDETAGHGTTALAKFYKQQLRDFLQAAPKRAM